MTQKSVINMPQNRNDVNVVLGTIVTSIRIDKGLWKMAKLHAVRNDLTLTKLIERSLRKELEKSK